MSRLTIISLINSAQVWNWLSTAFFRQRKTRYDLRLANRPPRSFSKSKTMRTIRPVLKSIVHSAFDAEIAKPTILINMWSACQPMVNYSNHQLIINRSRDFTRKEITIVYKFRYKPPNSFLKFYCCYYYYYYYCYYTNYIILIRLLLFCYNFHWIPSIRDIFFVFATWKIKNLHGRTCGNILVAH